jgi:hypothetical protein
MRCCKTLSLQHLLFSAVLMAAVSPLAAQEVEYPPKYTLLYEASGDLDKDNVPEKAVIYNTPDTNAENGGIIREIIIYKQSGNQWIPWHRSREALLDSKSGGMMGDPFQEMEIDKGILSILQAGGSSWHWSRYDKYRFQNGRFELIGYTSEFGKHCVEWTTIDYNLSTGKISARKTYDQCDDNGDNLKTIKTEQDTFTHKLASPILLDKRELADVKIVSPKYKFELYL